MFLLSFTLNIFVNFNLNALKKKNNNIKTSSFTTSKVVAGWWVAFVMFLIFFFFKFKNHFYIWHQSNQIKSLRKPSSSYLSFDFTLVVFLFFFYILFKNKTTVTNILCPFVTTVTTIKTYWTVPRTKQYWSINVNLV